MDRPELKEVKMKTGSVVKFGQRIRTAEMHKYQDVRARREGER